MCSPEIAKFFAVRSVVKPGKRFAHTHTASLAFHLILGRVPRRVLAMLGIRLICIMHFASKIRPSVADKNRGFSNGWRAVMGPLVKVLLFLKKKYFLAADCMTDSMIDSMTNPMTDLMADSMTNIMNKSMTDRGVNLMTHAIMDPIADSMNDPMKNVTMISSHIIYIIAPDFSC